MEWLRMHTKQCCGWYAMRAPPNTQAHTSSVGWVVTPLRYPPWDATKSARLLLETLNIIKIHSYNTGVIYKVSGVVEDAYQTASLDRVTCHSIEWWREIDNQSMWSFTGLPIQLLFFAFWFVDLFGQNYQRNTADFDHLPIDHQSTISMAGPRGAGPP